MIKEDISCKLSRGGKHWMSYILIRKEGFRTSNIMDKDTFYKNSIHQDITIHNEHASYNRTSKYMMQNPIEL